MDLRGRTALVTGASRGIGRALVEALAQAGVSRIIAVARGEGALREIVATRSSTVVPIVADLSSAEEVRRLAREVEAQAPELSLLVNNAGVQMQADLVGGDFESLWPDLARELAVNLHAPIALSGVLLPTLKRQKDAAIVNVTTGLVLAPKSGAPVYCAAKAGLSAFSRSLRYQCERDAPDVRVVEALPPMVDTDMTAGRGRGKISAAECARQIVEGVRRDRVVIDVGKTKALRLLMRLAPSIGYGIMRRG